MAAQTEATLRLGLIDRISAPIQRITRRIEALTSRLGFQKLGASFALLSKRISGVGSALGQSSQRLTRFLGLMGLGSAGAIAGISGLTMGVAKSGDELTHLAFRLGIGVEALQEWNYTAKIAGVSNEAFAKGAEKLGLNARAAATGNKNMAAAFRALGVRVTDANGKMRTNSEILDDTVSALASISDPAKRNAAAYAVMGKAGMEMVPMLEGGGKAIREMREEARRTGHVMSTEAAALGGTYVADVERLTTRLTGLKNLIGVSLLPVLDDLVTSATDWYDANQTLIRSTITEWVERLVQFIQDLRDPTSEVRTGFDGMVTSVTGFLDAIKPVVDYLGGPGNAALVGLAVYISGPLIAAFAALAPAVLAFGAALMATPLGWIAAGLAAVGAAVYLLVTNWDSVVAAWDGAWDAITSAFSGFATGMGAAWNGFAEWASGIGASIAGWFTVDLGAIGASMVGLYLDALRAEWSLIAGWAETLNGALMEWFGIDLRPVGEAIVNSLLDGLKAAWTQLTSWLNDSIAGLVSILPDWAKEGLGIQVQAKVLTEEEMASRAKEAGRRAGDSVAEPWFWASDEEKAQVASDRATASTNAEAAELARLRAENERLKASQPVDWSASIPSAIASKPVETPAFEAATLRADSIVIPEPIIAHQPQQVDASMVVNLTVNANGLSASEAERAAENAIAKAAARQRANITSTLND